VFQFFARKHFLSPSSSPELTINMTMATSARNGSRKECKPIVFVFTLLVVVVASHLVGDVRVADAFSVTAPPHGFTRVDSSVRIYMSLSSDDLSFSARSLSDHRKHESLNFLSSSDQSGKFRSLAKKQQMSPGIPMEETTACGAVEKPRAKYQRAEHWDADRTVSGENGGQSALAQLKQGNARWEKAFRSTFLG
jgi:hypothetical protein